MDEDLKSEDGTKKSKSLSIITSAFINYMKSQNGKEVELSQVENALNISKRRLYDVINVLAGIGVIERGGKSKIKWIEDPKKEREETIDEEPTIQQLLEYEQSIDAKLAALSNSLTNLLSVPEYKPYSYITISDFNNVIDNNQNYSKFVLTGPPDLQIEISDNLNENNFLKITGTSQSGNVNIIPLNDQNS